LKPYAAAFASGFLRALREPGEIAVRVIFYAVILVVFAALWRAAVEANGGSISGYDYPSLLWYVAGAEGAVIATKPRMIEDIGEDIGSGDVAVEMLRPVSVVGFRIMVEMGEAMVRLSCAVAIGAIFVAARVGLPPDPVAAALVVPAAVLAVACNLSTQFAFAGAAFWMHESKGMWFLYQKLVFLVGGMLLPLELMPSWLAAAARVLPFWTMSYIPARLLSGHFEPALIVVQIGWLGALIAAALWVFSMGERRLQAVGG
jgi:ABC-2 type transport system permease protein